MVNTDVSEASIWARSAACGPLVRYSVDIDLAKFGHTFQCFGSRVPGPKDMLFVFYKLIDLGIFCWGPWLKDSELSYVSSYDPR